MLNHHADDLIPQVMPEYWSNEVERSKIWDESLAGHIAQLEQQAKNSRSTVEAHTLLLHLTRTKASSSCAAVSTKRNLLKNGDLRQAMGWRGVGEGFTTEMYTSGIRVNETAPALRLEVRNIPLFVLQGSTQAPVL